MYLSWTLPLPLAGFLSMLWSLMSPLTWHYKSHAAPQWPSEKHATPLYTSRKTLRLLPADRKQEELLRTSKEESEGERERERVREELECLGKKWRGSEWGKRDVRAARSEKHSHGGWTQCNQMQECCLSHFLLWRTLLNQPHLTGLVFGERDYLISVFNIKHLSGQVSCEATTLESKNCLFASD